MKIDEVRGAFAAALAQGADPTLLLLALPVEEDAEMTRQDGVRRAVESVGSLNGEPIRLGPDGQSQDDLGALFLAALDGYALGAVVSAEGILSNTPEVRVIYVLVDFDREEEGRHADASWASRASRARLDDRVIACGPPRSDFPRAKLGTLDRAVWFDACAGRACDMTTAVARAVEVTATMLGGLRPRTGFTAGPVGQA